LVKAYCRLLFNLWRSGRCDGRQLIAMAVRVGKRENSVSMVKREKAKIKRGSYRACWPDDSSVAGEGC